MSRTDRRPARWPLSSAPLLRGRARPATRAAFPARRGQQGARLRCASATERCRCRRSASGRKPAAMMHAGLTPLPRERGSVACLGQGSQRKWGPTLPRRDLYGTRVSAMSRVNRQEHAVRTRITLAVPTRMRLHKLAARSWLHPGYFLLAFGLDKPESTGFLSRRSRVRDPSSVWLPRRDLHGFAT